MRFSFPVLAMLACNVIAAPRQAPIPSQGPAVVIFAGACGKPSCDCGCASGGTCVCAVPSQAVHNYDVGGGKVVQARSWEEAYRKAGVTGTLLQAAPAYAPPAYNPAPAYSPASFAPSYAPSFGGYSGGYSLPSYGYGGGCANGSCGAGG